MPKAPENLREFSSLLKVVEHLRGPDGCPWDKEQTAGSLTRFAIEEAFELAEAIDSGDVGAFKDELGDLLLQVILHSEIARQEGKFDVFDVIQNLSEKMVRRHPHVFADVKVGSSGEVLANWAEIKKAEGKTKIFDIPSGMPSLLRAHKIGEKTKKLSFDWENAAQCWEKVDEELDELEEAKAAVVREHARAERYPAPLDHTPVKSVTGVNLTAEDEELEKEFGDVLFSLVQWARHMKIDSEQALRKTNMRFEARFERMQSMVKAAGLDWSTLSPAEKEKYWKQAKS
jgi:tetrapyrrole methylase family protein / MazG family protein